VVAGPRTQPPYLGELSDPPEPNRQGTCYNRHCAGGRGWEGAQLHACGRGNNCKRATNICTLFSLAASGAGTRRATCLHCRRVRRPSTPKGPSHCRLRQRGAGRREDRPGAGRPRRRAARGSIPTRGGRLRRRPSRAATPTMTVARRHRHRVQHRPSTRWRPTGPGQETATVAKQPGAATQPRRLASRPRVFHPPRAPRAQPAPARGPVHHPLSGRVRPASTAAHPWHASLSFHPQRSPTRQARYKGAGR